MQGEFVLMNSAFKYIGLYSIPMVTEVPCENILKYNQLADTAATGQEKINDLQVRTNLSWRFMCHVLPLCSL